MFGRDAKLNTPGAFNPSERLFSADAVGTPGGGSGVARPDQLRQRRKKPKPSLEDHDVAGSERGCPGQRLRSVDRDANLDRPARRESVAHLKGGLSINGREASGLRMLGVMRVSRVSLSRWRRHGPPRLSRVLAFVAFNTGERPFRRVRFARRSAPGGRGCTSRTGQSGLSRKGGRPGRDGPRPAPAWPRGWRA